MSDKEEKHFRIIYKDKLYSFSATSHDELVEKMSELENYFFKNMADYDASSRLEELIDGEWINMTSIEKEGTFQELPSELQEQIIKDYNEGIAKAN